MDQVSWPQAALPAIQVSHRRSQAEPAPAPLAKQPAHAACRDRPPARLRERPQLSLDVASLLATVRPGFALKRGLLQGAGPAPCSRGGGGAGSLRWGEALTDCLLLSSSSSS